MALPVLADLHVHSRFSEDSSEELDSVCQAAIEKGLTYIAFTEHIDMNPADHGYGFFDYKAFSEAIDAARRNYGERIQILKGLEFSEPHLYPAELEQMTRRDFDIILGSVHFLGEIFVGEKRLREQYSCVELFEKYYEQVLQTVTHGGFDVLAHLDFPKRYHGSVAGSHWTSEIFEQMVKQGIGLEINTSPLRKGINECSPSLDLLQQYIAAGGSMITLGSDAHRIGDIAAGFETAAAMVAQVEKAQTGVFVNRAFIPIANHASSKSML